LSKVITKPRFVEKRIPIGDSPDTPRIRVVPETKYMALEQSLESRVEESYRKGVEEGKQAGYSEGLVTGKSESKAITDQLQPMLGEIVRQKNEIINRSETDLLQLVLILTEKIIGSITASQQELILDTIKKSLPILLEKSKLTIKIAPEQEDFVSKNLENIMALDSDLKEIKIEADRRVGVGGCILETSSGRVDARIDKQIGLLTSALTRQISSDEN
jgi:flagellar assembly protein FliH